MLPSSAVAELVDLEHTMGAVCPASPLPTPQQVPGELGDAPLASCIQHPTPSRAAPPSSPLCRLSASGGEGVVGGGHTLPHWIWELSPLFLSSRLAGVSKSWEGRVKGRENC